ncbi:hypothetical protein F5882DRAFT_471744 [Hyaloscypha sp. PMI_1271]|nr:hypothetical protein F5882DRAFT_471744 [Hyaloscypha sp. PMI_1271]
MGSNFSLPHGDLKPEVREAIDGLERLGFGKWLSHTSETADSLSSLANSASAILDATAETIISLKKEALAALSAAGPDLRNILKILGDNIGNMNGKMEDTLSSFTDAIAKIEPQITNALGTVTKALKLITALAVCERIGTFLVNTYSTVKEVGFRSLEANAKAMRSDLLRIKMFSGTTCREIALTNLLGVKAVVKRFRAQHTCPSEVPFKNMFVGGSTAVWSYLEDLRGDHPEINELFFNGYVHVANLRRGLELGEKYHLDQMNEKTEKAEKYRMPFIAYHFVDHVGPLRGQIVTEEPNLVVPINVAAAGFGIIGIESEGIPRTVLHITSSVLLSEGVKKPLFKTLNPYRLENVLYYGPGYGDGLLGPLHGWLWGTGVGAASGAAEIGAVKLTHAGLLKLALGKCVSVSTAVSGFSGVPVVFGIGYECWDRKWRNHYYEPEKLWRRYGPK